MGINNNKKKKYDNYSLKVVRGIPNFVYNGSATEVVLNFQFLGTDLDYNMGNSNHVKPVVHQAQKRYTKFLEKVKKRKKEKSLPIDSQLLIKNIELLGQNN